MIFHYSAPLQNAPLESNRLHYGRFWENLSKNYGMNFDFSGCIFILFLKIIGFKVSKTVDCLPSFEFFEIEAKIQLQWLNLKLEFLDKNTQNRP